MPVFGDVLQCLVKLITAIATQRLDQVARKTTAVHAHKRRLVLLGWLAHHDRDRLLGFVLYLISVNCKLTIASRKYCLSMSRNQFFTDTSISDQVLDRDDAQVLFFCNLHQLITIGSIAIVIQDFAQNAGGLQSSHASQIDRRLGVPGSS